MSPFRLTPYLTCQLARWLFFTLAMVSPATRAVAQTCSETEHVSVAFYQAIRSNIWNKPVAEGLGSYLLRCTSIGIAFDPSSPRLLQAVDLQNRFSCLIEIDEPPPVTNIPKVETSGEPLRIRQDMLPDGIVVSIESLAKSMAEIRPDGCVGRIILSGEASLIYSFQRTLAGTWLDVSSAKGQLRTSNVLDFPVSSPSEALRWRHLASLSDFIGGVLIAVGPRGLVASDHDSVVRAVVSDGNIGDVFRFTICNHVEYDRRVDRVKTDLPTSYFNVSYDDAMSAVVAVGSGRTDPIPFLFCGETN